MMPAPLLQLVPWIMAGIAMADASWFHAQWWMAPAVLLLAAMVHRRPLLQGALLGLGLMLLAMVLTSRCRARLEPKGTGRSATLHAVVVSEAVQKERSVAVDLFIVEHQQRVKAYLHTDERSLGLLPGHGLLLNTRIEPTAHLRVGSFDYGRYLQVHGFSGRCFAEPEAWRPCPVAWQQLPLTEQVKTRALRWRHDLLLRLSDAAQGDSLAFGVLAAMTLGHKALLDDHLRQVYSLTGASHVLALSGMHIGILFCLLSLLMRPGRRSAVASLLTVLLVWAFALLTGLSTSVVRSALMLSLSAVLALRSGGRLSLNVLSLAAIIMLLTDPYTLFDVGFQLSFMAVFAILVLGQLPGSFLAPACLQAHPLWRRLWTLMAVGVAAQAGTAPLVAFYFGKLSLCFIVTNMVAVPCAYAILWLALAFLLCPLALTGKVLMATVSLLNTSLTVMASWPWASVSDLHPSVAQVVLAYVAIASLVLCVGAMVRGYGGTGVRE